MNRTERLEEPLIEAALDNAYDSNYDTLTPQQQAHWENALAEGEARVNLANKMLGRLSVTEGEQ